MELATRGLQEAVQQPAGVGGGEGEGRVASAASSGPATPERKCVKREVCFATEVPGSVARTGCTSLFCKHVWAPNVLYPRGLQRGQKLQRTMQ